MKKRFSIILPIYKNEENLPITVPYIIENLSLFPDYDVEIIMVCDGSPDNSFEIMKKYQRQYPELIKIASFNKNYGQRAAVNCGMSMATGDVIGVISADLQDPFELFAEMLHYWEIGHKFVLARREGRYEKGISVKCSGMLHRFINKNINPNYPIGGFDFFVVDKSIADYFVQADTPNNSMQLLLLDIAGTPKELGYIRQKRIVGHSGWSLVKKVNQAINIFSIYTDKPFWVLAYVGFLEIVISILLFSGALCISKDVYLAIISLGMLMLGILLAAVAYLGICGFRWMQNTKKTPRYIIDKVEK